MRSEIGDSGFTIASSRSLRFQHVCELPCPQQRTDARCLGLGHPISERGASIVLAPVVVGFARRARRIVNQGALAHFLENAVERPRPDNGSATRHLIHRSEDVVTRPLA